MVDQGAEGHYRSMTLNYRPRFTPILRALGSGAETVSNITQMTHLTQGAVSQSVQLSSAMDCWSGGRWKTRGSPASV